MRARVCTRKGLMKGDYFKWQDLATGRLARSLVMRRDIVIIVYY